MKLKLIKDPKIGLCVVAEYNNDLVENIKSVSLDIDANGQATMTLVAYIPKEDVTIKEESINDKLLRDDE